MEQIVKQYIIENKLLQNGQTVLVALSGGMDSVALFHILNKLKEQIGFSIVCAHYNHGIRDNAKRDAKFAEKLAKNAGVSFYLGQGDVPSYARDNGISIEMAARELRYKFLYEAKNKTGADFIATAHHKTDQAETVLLNIIRGSGPLGISGMKNKNGVIIRPFLCVTREQISDYIKINKLPHVEDETNEDNAYKRNSIRNELVPMLKTYNPSIEDAIIRMADVSSCDEEYINESAIKAMQNMFSFENNEYILLRSNFAQEHLSIKRAIIRIILRKINSIKDISFNRLSEILDFIENSSTGSIFIINNQYKILHDYGKLYFVKNQQKKERSKASFILKKGIYKTIYGTFKVGFVDAKEAFMDEGEYFDLDKLEKYSSVFRNRQDGDFIKPLGGHTKKLKDYFIDKKVPKRQRDEAVLLASGSEILWIVGRGISDNIKVDERSKKCVHIIFGEGKKYNA